MSPNHPAQTLSIHFNSVSVAPGKQLSHPAASTFATPPHVRSDNSKRCVRAIKSRRISPLGDSRRPEIHKELNIACKLVNKRVSSPLMQFKEPRTPTNCSSSVYISHHSLLSTALFFDRELSRKQQFCARLKK